MTPDSCDIILQVLELLTLQSLTNTAIKVFSREIMEMTDEMTYIILTIPRFAFFD